MRAPSKRGVGRATSAAAGPRAASGCVTPPTGRTWQIELVVTPLYHQFGGWRLLAHPSHGGDLDDVVGIARSRRVDGMIVGNTTLARPQYLRETAIAKEAGGLSGAPLLPLSNRMLAETYVRVEGVFPLIGAGGIDSGATALSKIRAGASLIQLYSGLVFAGLGLVADIKRTLIAALDRDRAASLAEYVGTDAASATAEPWPE